MKKMNNYALCARKHRENEVLSSVLKTKKMCVATTIMLSVSITNGAIAETDIRQELDQVVVTASRIEEKVKESPTTINVVDEEHIEKLKFRNPTDMLYQIPGIMSGDTGNEGEITSVRVQTSWGNPYTIVLVDGVPVQNYGSGSSGQFAEINTDDISRVEIIKGPASALYGSNAIGGVINVITKNPSSKPQVKLSSEYGRGDYWRSGISGGASGEKASFNVSLNSIQNKGMREHSELDKKTGNIKVQLPFEDSLLSFKLGLLRSEADSPGNLTKAEFEQNWMHSYGLTFSNLDKISSTLSYSYYFDEAEFTTTLSLRDLERDNIPTYNIRENTDRFGVPDGTWAAYLNNTKTKAANLNFLYSRDLKPLESKIIAGLDTEKDEQDYLSKNITVETDPTASLLSYTSYAINSSGTIISKDHEITTKMYAPFIQVQVSPIDKLRITAGGRYDVVEYTTSGYTSGRFGPTDIGGTKSFNNFTPKVGATYDFTSWFNGYLSYSQGFVVPTTSQLYTGSGANADLNPEKAENYEIGIRSSLLQGKLGLDLALYTMAITDKILADGAYYGAPNVNAGETSVDGFEAAAVYAPIDMVKLTMAYSYSVNQFDKYTPAVPQYDDNYLHRSPKHHINVRLAVMPLDGLEVELEVDDISSQYYAIDNLAQYSRPTLVNLRGTYNWNQWSAWAHLKNLTNEHYSSLLSGDGTSDTDLNQYPGSPMSLFAGVSYKWGE